MNTCGCGRKARFEVYKHREPHCFDCMVEAVSINVPVEVRLLSSGYKGITKSA